MCHLALFLPVFALPLFWLLPLPLAASFYALVALASLALYVAAVKAMRWPRLNGSECLVGKSGRIVQRGERGATVRVGGELWLADIEGRAMAPGDEVLIVGIDGLKLTVRGLQARGPGGP